MRIRVLTPADATRTDSLLGAPPAYWLDLRDYDAPAAAAALDLPLLILHGGRDYQVTEEDLANWRRVLEGRPGVRLRAFPALNHLFIAGQGPSGPQEYLNPGFVAGEVIEEIAHWIYGLPAAPTAP